MKHLQQYLQRTIDDKATLEKYDVKDKLSLFIAGSYDFYIVRVMDVQFILVKSLEERTVSQLQKQMNLLEKKLGMPAVLMAETLTTYKKKKLILEKVPFICLDNQMYLPFLGLHLQMRAKDITEEKNVEHFTPAMQLIYLWILYNSKEDIIQQEISELLNVTTMTSSRALDAFVKMGLLKYSIAGQTGRKKIYHCSDKKAFFQDGRKYLINPVKKIFFASRIPETVKTYSAGLSAIGDKTMLGNPDHPIIAICSQNEGELRKYQVPKDMALEEKLYEVQVMKYDISLLTEDNCVEPVSLILSLEEKDERIEIAIDEMMEEYTWYEA